MKKRCLVLLALLLLSGCAGEPAPPQSIRDFHPKVEALDSHADDTSHSQLEFDFRSRIELGEAELGVSAPNYPRLKRLPDGSYLLFYQDGQIGWNIYCAASPDLRAWSEPAELFSSHLIKEDTDYRCYSTCDAAVLEDGRILAVCSFRSNAGYTHDLYNDGLMLRISDDGGKTWSGEREIYLGSNWEPQLLQLPSGEIQLYFTHAAPKVCLEGVTNSTGTAILRSRDRGETWTPAVKGPPFAAERICQQYVRTDENGIRLYTNQMPCAVALHCGGIALATESQLAGGYAISLAYSADSWGTALAMDEEGPGDRQDNLFPGAAPYLLQFPSGETVLSYNDQTMYVRMGDAGARKFSCGMLLPFDALGYWGSLELVDSHTLAAAFPGVTPLGSTILLAEARLNHRLDVPAQPVRVDGSSAEWAGNTHALFLGSESESQLSIRAARDGEVWYFCFDWLAAEPSGADAVELYLTNRDANTMDRAVRLRFTPEGTLTAQRFGPDGWRAERSAGSALACVKAGGTGCVAELGVPQGWFSQDRLALHAVLYHADGEGRTVADSIGLLKNDEPTGWITLRPD